MRGSILYITVKLKHILKLTADTGQVGSVLMLELFLRCQRLRLKNLIFWELLVGTCWSKAAIF